MRKEVEYYKTCFPVSVIKEAVSLIGEIRNIPEQQPIFNIKYGNEKWDFNTIDEFFAGYVKFHYAHLWVTSWHNTALELLAFENGNTTIAVSASNWKDVEKIFNIFEKNADKSKIAVESIEKTSKKEPIKVFIGHGRDEQWRLLKDHLHDYHGIDVTAYEIGPRAGLSVKEVLEDMLNKSSIAFLVLTGEDPKNDGELHARQNVVHELGLFQGRLGFKRGIAILEDGVTEFSNIYGVNQIRFSKGNIRETFGDVIATIKREFER